MVLLGAFELPLKLLGLAGKTFDYPIYFDLEEQSQLSRGRAFCDSLVKAFCEEMEKGGYFAGFYTSTFVMANILSPSIRKRFAFWCARGLQKIPSKGSAGSGSTRAMAAFRGSWAMSTWTFPTLTTRPLSGKVESTATGKVL